MNWKRGLKFIAVLWGGLIGLMAVAILLMTLVLELGGDAKDAKGVLMLAGLTTVVFLWGALWE